MKAKLDAAFAAGELEGLHSVLVLYRGEVFAEAHYPGVDEAWGKPLGARRHGPDVLHDLRSVTKSIVSLLYGIALADGLVPPVDTPLVDGFPEYPDLAADPARRRIRVEDALTMRMGVEWDETRPYSDPRNSEIAMERADDRYRYALSRPVTGPPGEAWVYNGGATALIARLIAKGAGKSIDAYAREKLFEPLGIMAFEWARGRDGAPSAASGLRLNVHGLARIGQMVLQRGAWDGRQIVPKTWLAASQEAHADAGELDYGYFWWLAKWGDPPPLWAAGFGNGGQRLTVQARSNLVVVVFAGNYNQPDAWKLPVKVLLEFVYPAFDRLRTP